MRHPSPWPTDVLTAPADISLLHAHALAVQYQLPLATHACHSGWRGELATTAIRRWRELVDHATSFALLAPSGRAEHLQTYRYRYRDLEATFRRWISILAHG